MRDIVLTVLVLGLVPLIFKTPYFGALMWAWLAMMNPHKLTYGFAQTFPFAYVVAIVTMLAFVFSSQRKTFPWNSITAVHLCFIFWMGVTTAFAMNRPDIVQDRVIFVAKIQVMYFLTLMLIRGRRQIEHLIVVVTFSLAFFGIKGGFFTLMTGGAYRVWGPLGSMVEGNNELGLALIMLVPFVYYLREIATTKWLKRGLLLSIVLIVFCILGTQSRGALLALLAMSVVLGLKGKYPVRTILAIGLLVGVAIVFMPNSWTERMDTINSYEQDASAMSRLYTWKTLWNLAMDRPFVGAGFATDNPVVFALYGPKEGIGSYMGGSVLVAHSIYFQALGEHGFPGLILYLLLGVTTWRTATRLSSETRDDPEFNTWIPLLMRMVQVSLVGFAVGGAFLTLVHFDFPYYIVGYVVLVDATVKERKRKRRAELAKTRSLQT